MSQVKFLSDSASTVELYLEAVLGRTKPVQTAWGTRVASSVLQEPMTLTHMHTFSLPPPFPLSPPTPTQTLSHWHTLRYTHVHICQP